MLHLTKLARTVPVAIALGISGAAVLATAPASFAGVSHTTMAPVTKTGKFVKLISKSSFDLSSGSMTYVVTVNDMTHVTLQTKKVALAKLKKGDTVTVKGPLDMHTIKATTVTAGM